VARRVTRVIRAAEPAGAAEAAAVLATVSRSADRAGGRPGRGQPDLNVAIVPAAGPPISPSPCTRGCLRHGPYVRVMSAASGDTVTAARAFRPALRQRAQLYSLMLATFRGVYGQGKQIAGTNRAAAEQTSEALPALPGLARGQAPGCYPAGVMQGWRGGDGMRPSPRFPSASVASMTRS
jgi:hypothetical protein